MNISDYLYQLKSKALTKFGDLYFATTPPLTNTYEMDKVRETAQAGDVLCRGYDAYVDGYFIPNTYSHSGIVVGKDKMIHMIAEGCLEISVGDFVKDTDRHCILRPDYASADHMQLTIDKALSLVGKCDYDFNFCLNNSNRLYCNELSALSLIAAGIDVTPDIVKLNLLFYKIERQIYLYESIKRACPNMVLEFNPEGK